MSGTNKLVVSKNTEKKQTQEQLAKDLLNANTVAISSSKKPNEK